MPKVCNKDFITTSMNSILMSLLLTLDKYLFCTETFKFGNHKSSYVQHNAGCDKILCDKIL